MKIYIIIPLYNEHRRGVKTIERVLEVCTFPIIVVDDGSTDMSYEMLNNRYSENKRVILLRHIINLGKGAAMKTGAEMAWKMGAETIIFIDADGQHNPAHIPAFEKALQRNQIVFGFREMNSSMPRVRKWGNLLAVWIIGLLFNIKRKDLLCGYLGFRKDVYKKILWKSARYGIETEMATKVGKNKLAFEQIKVDTIYIDKYKGVSILDALKILTRIPFWYFEK